jgi:hypothetical protein
MSARNALDTSSDHPAMDLTKLAAELAAAQDDTTLFKLIVNAPFEQKVETAFLFLGIVVLLTVNDKTRTIDRIALSDTELAQNTRNVSVVPFEEIKIGLDEPENIIAATVRTGQAHDTTDWRFLFEPVLTPEQARINQASAGIAYSAVYPLKARRGGALIFSYFQYLQEIGQAQRDFMTAYRKLVDERLTQ